MDDQDEALSMIRPCYHNFHFPPTPKQNTQNAKRILNLLAHGGGTTLAGIDLCGLGLGDSLGKESVVLGSSILGLLSVTALQCDAVALVLETLRSDQALDLWCLCVWLLSLSLWLNLSSNNELTDIVFLGETKELADLGSALWTETLWVDDICDAWDFGLSLLDDAECEDGKIHGDDASTDGFTLALSSSAGSVAGVSLGKEKADTSWVHDTLLHWETLLVVATGNSEDISLELVSDGVTRNLCAHSLVHEDAQLLLVLNFDELLTAIGRK